jgi:hypothetical protein
LATCPCIPTLHTKTQPNRSKSPDIRFKPRPGNPRSACGGTLQTRDSREAAQVRRRTAFPWRSRKGHTDDFVVKILTITCVLISMVISTAAFSRGSGGGMGMHHSSSVGGAIGTMLVPRHQFLGHGALIRRQRRRVQSSAPISPAFLPVFAPRSGDASQGGAPSPRC